MKQTINQIQAKDHTIAKEVIAYLDTLTKPPGSLGRLEELAVELAEMTRNPFPTVTPPGIIVFAADHGVVSEGVSAFPQEVTTQMVYNFLNGGSAINVLANQIGASLKIVDVGVATDLSEKGFINKKVRYGTANFSVENAMSPHEAEQAINAGVDVANQMIAEGSECLILGEMGIGNTTSSSAILAVISGQNSDLLVGNGTGISGDKLKHKQQIIQQAMIDRRPDRNDPIDILSKLGGLEIAGMTGAILAAAANKKPVVIDGFISTIAALLATKLAKGSRDYMIFGHKSQEPGHKYALDLLHANPILDLNFRLGEGTGGAMAFPIIVAATKILKEMATFTSAGVSDGSVQSEKN